MLAALQSQGLAHRAPEPGRAKPPDFVLTLPETAAIDAVVQDFQRFSAAAGALLVAVDAVPRPAAPSTVGRVELAVSLRGDYSKLKSVLAQVLDRYPNLLLQRASLRRAGSSADLEAAVALSLLTRPAATSGGR